MSTVQSTGGKEEEGKRNTFPLTGIIYKVKTYACTTFTCILIAKPCHIIVKPHYHKGSEMEAVASQQSSQQIQPLPRRHESREISIISATIFQFVSLT